MATQDFEHKLHGRITDIIRAHVGTLQENVILIQSQVQQAFTAFLEQSEVDFQALTATDASLSQALHDAATELFSAGAASVPPPPPVQTGTDLALLKAALQDIQSHQTQADVLTALVNHAAEFTPRVALFIVKAGNVVGWNGRGFEDGANNNAVRGLSISLQADTLLRTVLGRQATFSGSPTDQADNHLLASSLGNLQVERIVGIPLLVRKKAAAVLYADSGSQGGDTVGLESLEILTNLAGLTVELISLRGRNVPTAAAHETAPPESPAKPEPPPEPPKAEASTPQAPPEPAVEPEPAPEPEPPPAYAYQPEPPPPPPEPAWQSPAPPAYAHQPEPPPPAHEPAWQPPAPPAYAHQPEPPPPAHEPAWQPPAPPAYAHQPEPPPPAHEPAWQPPAPPAYAYQPEPPPPPPEPAWQPPAPPAYAYQPEPPPPPPEPAWQPPAPPAYAYQPEPPPPPPEPAWQPPAPPAHAYQPEPPPPPPEPAWQPPAPPAYAYQPEPPPPPPEPAWQPPAPPAYAYQPEPPPPPPEPAWQPSAPPEPVWQAPPPEPPPPPPPPPPVLGQRGMTGRLTFPDMSEEEQKLHNDARRFARLLVSEIKLYNEPKVIEGRKNNDLYDRLKEDIDRSRQMYDKRVNPTVSARFDYFYDELVNTLGENDPTKLGRDCPGPQLSGGG